jgi:hypothetical protein
MQTKKSKFLLILVMGVMLLWMASNVVAAALNESFTGTTFPPDQWTLYNFNGGNAWARYTTYYNTTPACARVQYDAHNNDWLITPRLDITAGDTLLTFYYRAHSSSYTETLYVKVSTSATVSDTTLYSTIASVITASTTFAQYKVSLNGYVGQKVYVAFVYQCWDNYGWAIDDVTGPNIYTLANDMAATAINNPTAGALLAGNSSISVQATVKNVGSATQNQVPVNLLITDGVGYTYTDVESTGSLVQNATQLITFAPNWTVPNAVASYTIKVWTALSGDQVPANDTVTISVAGYKSGYVVEGFEGATFPPDKWAKDANWNRGSVSGYAHSGTYYAYASQQDAWLFTPLISVGSGDGMIFYYRAESATYPTSFRVRLSTGSQTDTSGYTTILADYPNVSSTTYLQGKIDLSAYKGKVYIAFERYYGASTAWYLFLDDVAMPPAWVPANDVGVTKVFPPPVSGQMYKVGIPDSIGMAVKNFGSVGQSGFWVHYDLALGTGTDSVLHTNTIAAGITDTVFAPWTPGQTGVDTVYAWTALPLDEVPGNDLFKGVVYVFSAGVVLYEDFEATTPPAFNPGWLVVNSNGDAKTWLTLASGGISTGNPKCAEYPYNSASAADDWFFSPALTLQAGKTYELDFFYKAGSATWPERMRVHFATCQAPACTLSRTWDNDNIINTTYAKGTATFVPSTKGTYYLGFYCYSLADELNLYVDSIMLYIPPPHLVLSPDSLVIPMSPDQILDTTFFVNNTGGEDLTYSMLENPDATWLSENPTGGTILPAKTDTIHLHLDATGYGLGAYRTVLEITSNSQKGGEKATSYFPVTMKIGGPILTLSPDSIHVGLCPPATKDTVFFKTNTGNEPLEIYGVQVIQTSPKDVKFYMGTLPKEEPKQGKDDESNLNNQASPSRRQMTYKSGGPDIYGHYWRDSDDLGGPTFSWIDITGTGTQIIGLADDNNLGPFPIGFNFNFYGTNFSSIHVCSNGWFSFTSTATSYTDYALPSASAPENLLAIFWDDMNFNLGGTAYYQTIGDKFILEFKDAPRYSYGYLYTYEMILDKTCGTITYQYLSMEPGMLNSATIGIQNALKTDGLTIAYDEYYVHDSLAIQIQTTPLWVSLEPCNEIDTLATSESDSMMVIFDSSPYASGNFRGEIRVSSNQPGYPTKALPIAMDILAPALATSPASISDTCQEGGTAQSTLNIQNSGNCPLNFSIGAGCSWVSVLPTGGSLNPGQNMDVTVTQDCSNLYAGNYVCELRISSNDPAQQPYKVVNIYKHVGPDPAIAVSPDSFHVELFAGTTLDTSLDISNNGAGHLVYGISTEDFTPPKVGIPILTEGFEGSWPPSGWSIIQNNYDVNYYNCWWSQLSVYAHTGTYSAGLWWDYYDQDEWLITPEFTLAGPCSLSFWTYGYEGSTYGDHYYVKISTDGGSSWDVLFDLSTLPPNGWNYYDHPYNIGLDAYAGQNVKIAWHAYAIGGLYWAWLIDDVDVESYAPPWLVVGPPTSGVIDPGKATTTIPVHFSTEGITVNDKYAHIFIASNDPVQSMVALTAHMKVVGPNYSISPPETLVIDALEDQQTDGHLIVSNVGGFGPLYYKMTDPVAWLSEIPDTTEVPGGSTQDVIVRVDGTQLIAGDYETKVFIKTNDFNVPKDTVVVIVHMGPPAGIAIDPTSFEVQVVGGTSKDSAMIITNTGDGHLSFQISTVETGGPKLSAGAGFNLDEGYRILERSWQDRPKPVTPSLTGTENPRTHLTASSSGNASLSGGFPGNPKAKGDTVYTQLPTDPSGSWSAGTSDQGAGYKVYENFWGVTQPIAGIGFWGLPMIYSGGWLQGNPNNLVFDITFYSDPPDDPTMPPTQAVCTYLNVVPSSIVPDGVYSGFQGYLFSGIDLNPICNLPEGWVSIQSKSAGQGYDWFLWMSATSGDGYSYQEGSGDYFYDDAFFLIGGQLWLTVAPKADTVNPHTPDTCIVTFDATNVLGGEKFGDILINSNAPGKRVDTVKVHMIVGGAQYAITPDSLHIEALENQYTNGYLTISNPGGQNPLSYKMTDPVAWLTENPDTADVPVDGNQIVTVRVDGYQLIAGNYLTQIAIKSNGANQQYDTIPVTVHIGPDAEMDIAPMSMDVGVLPGHNKVEKLKVNNLGGGHLSFVTEIEGAKGFVKVSGQGTINAAPAKLPPADAPVAKNGTLPGSTPVLSPRPDYSFGEGSPKQNVILSEGFEGTWPPAGWTVIQTSTDNSMPIPCWWTQTSYSVHSGTYSTGMWWSYYDQDEWLITPEVTLAGACTLSFWTYGWEGSAYGDHYWVKVSTDGGSTWDEVFDLSNLSGNAWNQWVYPYYIDLSAYAGQDVKIAWHAWAIGGLYYVWMIDDVTLTSSGPGCPFTVNPEADTLDPYSFIDLLVTIDGTAFAACDSETLQCNLIFQTNDPDESQVMVPVTIWALRGDADDDGVMNIVDVVFLLNYIFVAGPPPNPPCLGDVDKDGDVDSDDALYLISYLFLGGPPPELPLAPKATGNMGIKTIRPTR